MFTPWLNKQAAEHFLALHDSEAHPDAILAALLWLEQNAANQREFDRLQQFWNACGSVETFLPNADLSQAGSSSIWERTACRLIAAALVIAMGIGCVAFLYDQGISRPGSRGVSYASAVGETRVLNLADRSQIVLGGASAITVRYDTGVRQIVLSDGEALFNVAHDPHRPFLVDSGAGSIRAVGTSFNVHRGYAGTTVTVVHGTVEVKSRTPKEPTSGMLRSGMQLSYSADGEMTKIRRVNAAQVISWQSGTLRYAGQPLAIVLADLNRYSSRPILIDDPQVGLVEITGAVRIDGIVDWLSGLASATGLEIVDSDPGVFRLRVRAGTAAPNEKFPAHLPTTAS